MPRRSEIELFTALERDGDANDVAEFSDRLRRCAVWVLQRMSGGLALLGDVDEIVDDARVRLERLRARGFQGGSREFRSYLYKVVASACVEAANRQRLLTSLDAPIALPGGDERPLGDVLRELVDGAIASDAALERAGTAALVHRALGELDERCRTLLRRFHLEDAPIAALAAAAAAKPNAIEVALTRCRQRLYTAFVSLYVDTSDPGWKARVADVGRRLGDPLGRVFSAWWVENRSVLDISKGLGSSPGETKRWLAQAKIEVWRRVEEGEVR